MQRLAAQRLISEAPSRLFALLIHDRPPAGPTRRLCAAGDTGFSGRLDALIQAGPSPLCEIAPAVRSADLAFANLETPLLGDEPAGRLLAASSRAARLLAEAGFGLLNLANNHILDYGAEGLTETLGALRAAGVTTLGAGADPGAARRLVKLNLDGLLVGWLGCARTLGKQDPSSAGFWEYDPRELLASVRAARPEVDVLAVSIHMGYMVVDYPHPEQRRQVLRLLEAGADLVLLHHPHVLQGVEVAYSGPADSGPADSGPADSGPADSGLACYSLGNLLLDWREGELAVERMIEEQRSGGLFFFDLDRRGVARAFVLPVRVDDGLVVRWARGERGREILERLERLSDFSFETAPLFHRQLATRATGAAFRFALREWKHHKLRALLTLLPRLRPLHLRMVGGFFRETWLRETWLRARRWRKAR